MAEDDHASEDKESVAVALKYAREQDPAPRITASGRGTIAEQIIAIAEAQGIEVKEDTDLAELLATLEVDSLIPLEAYAAVAEILSYVYRANANQGRGEKV